ncbi:archaeosortase/exosortase family protein [Kordiimonas laminariae]|uniref:archaeosortase/exosortase family protein n=1 Tax=Kordiimonas laminariae TaxID=2917717 RepID=UPI001FF1D120|nr:archaeosortase/exosortase family protein [Kordiimonas laminariae]MCK0067840.1 archaeosortase/exosortase family protein [Kordiimonas laminariae]
MCLILSKYRLGALAAMVAVGFYLLLPLLEASLKTDHWAIIALSMFSILLIALGKPGERVFGRGWLLLLSALAFLLHIALDIQKLAYLSGMFLIVFTISECFKLSFKKTIWVTVCGVLMLPVPYGLEQSVGVWLATVEAEMFVTLAQLLDLPVYRYGSQVVSGEVTVTINTNCSGTLLFIPAFLGCLVCASIRDISLKGKLGIIASALPIAIGVNLLRLSVLLILNFQAPEDLVNTFHDFLGWFIMPIVWLLPVLIFLPLHELVLPDIRLWSKQAAAFAVALTVSSVSYTALSVTEKTNIEAISEIPNYVAGWVGERTDISAEEQKIISADFLSRKTFYAPTSERQLILTAIFHEDSNKSQQHSSAICFRALGWIVSHVEFQDENIDASIEHLLVRSHAQVQAVAEIVAEIPGKKGRLRLQIVEDPKIPLSARRAVALQFLEQIQSRLGKQS